MAWLAVCSCNASAALFHRATADLAARLAALRALASWTKTAAIKSASTLTRAADAAEYSRRSRSHMLQGGATGESGEGNGITSVRFLTIEPVVTEAGLALTPAVVSL